MTVPPRTVPYDAWKRAIDIAVSAVALVALAPVLALTALLVRIKLGRPVVFAQVRPGRGGIPFTCYKFRSMTDTRDAAGALLPDGVRLTPFGKALRAMSLDELPQLYNVLKGDMSLVGPRPLLMSYLPLYSPEQARRHEVRPGMTGYAQIHGRNRVPWDERFRMDVHYVDNRSFGLDCAILWQSVAIVLTRRGITGEGESTMSPFKGNESDDHPRP